MSSCGLAVPLAAVATKGNCCQSVWPTWRRRDVRGDDVGGVLTSGAVARRLFISPRIVDAHLLRMFARLGVPGRVALAAVVRH